MATVVSIQAALGTGRNAQILRTVRASSTIDSHYCVGGADAPGRARWCDTTAANTAAQQATSILSALRA